MSKSKEMEESLNNLAKASFGRERDFKYCVMCGVDVKGRRDFKNDISWKEFGISCMCQNCQDTVFSSGNEE